LNRRRFLWISAILGATPLFAKNGNRFFFKFPKKYFKFYYLKAKNPKYRVMLIGGMNNNEIGAYKIADLLVKTILKKGELIILKSNFASILPGRIDYNGNINSKFANFLQKKYDYYVELLKKAILEFKPDVVILMQDRNYFGIKNKEAFKGSIVIDEMKYKNFNLFNEANFVKNHANIYLNRKLKLINIKTFTTYNNKTLTSWCLENDIKAFCIEASKQLPSLEEKVKTHLIMLREFFKLYDVEIEELDEMIKEPLKYIKS